MGNVLRGSRKKTTKIMTINGDTTKHKTPIQATEITRAHPGHVLLDSDAVKQYGIRAKPIDPARFLEPKKVYFLVELPKRPDPEVQTRAPRRVRSAGIQMSATERLESLMLAKRSVSDLSAFRPPEEGAVTVKMRLPRAEVESLMTQSKDRNEAARKIVDLCVAGSGRPGGMGEELGLAAHDRAQMPKPARKDSSRLGGGDGHKKKRVGFLAVTEDELRFAASS